MSARRLTDLRTATLSLCVAMASTLWSVAAAAVIEQPTGGDTLAFNAVQADSISDPDGDGKVWTPKADPDALNAQVLAAPTSAAMAPPPHQSIATFQLRFQTAGTYRLYYRARNNGTAGNGGSDSFWRPSGFDVDPSVYTGTGTTGEFVWTTSTDFTVEEADVGEILEFRIGSREANAAVCSLVFSPQRDLSSDELDSLCSPLAVENRSPTEITTTSAVLHAEILATHGQTAEARIYWGPTDGGTDSGAWGHVERLGTQPVGAFEASISGLTGGNTVHYRAFSSTTLETAWAPATDSFVTPATVTTPTISTLPPATIFDTAARMTGRVDWIGGQRPEVRVYYGKTDGGTDTGAWEGWRDLGRYSEGECSAIVDGLATDTLHYYRFRAENDGGAAWATSSTLFRTDPAYVHPRLLFTRDELANVCDRRFTTHIQEWVRVVEAADAAARSDRPTDTPITNPDDMRRYEYDIESLALTQMIDPSQPYWDDFENYFWTVIRWPEWYNGGGGIRNGFRADLEVDHILRALAVSYDWLYDRFTWQEREEIRSRLIDYMDIHANWYAALSRDIIPCDSMVQNHPFNAYGSLASVAYGVDGVPDDRFAAWDRRLRDRVTSVTMILTNWMGDGGNNEGPPYHTYGLIQIEIWYEIMRSAGGLTDAQLCEATPWFRNTTLFNLYSIVPGHGENYAGVTPIGDGPPSFYYSPLYIEALLAKRLDNPLSQWLATQLDATINTASYRLYRYLWLDPTLPVRDPATLPNWHWFITHGYFMWRSSWDNDATHFFFRSGPHYSGHCQPDCGQFTIHRDSVPYVVDLGYATPKHTDEHNVLLVDGTGQYSEGTVWGNFESPQGDWPANDDNWGEMPHVLAEGGEYDAPGPFFNVIGNPAPMYQTAKLQKWNREFVGLGDLFLVRDTVAASESVDFDLLVHAYVSDAKDDGWDYTTHADENPWTTLSANQWRIDARDTTPEPPDLIVTDVSADAWSPTIEDTLYSPHNDDLVYVEARLGSRLRRRLTGESGTSLVSFGFTDQTGHWTLAPWSDGQCEGLRATITTSSARVVDVLWPRNGTACAASDGWTVQGKMAARHFGEAPDDLDTGYAGREVTLVRDGALDLVAATHPVSLLAHLEHSPTERHPLVATVYTDAAATVTLYAPYEPTDVLLAGTPVSYAYASEHLTLALPACPTTSETLRIEFAAIQGKPYFVDSPFDMADATEDILYGAILSSQATDPQGQPLSYQKISGPDWLDIASGGGCSGIPHNEDVGLSTFTIRATDPDGLFADGVMRIMTSNTNDPPEFAESPRTAPPAMIDAPYSASITDWASDPDVGDTVTYSKTAGPTWLSVAPDGTLSGTPSMSDTGTNVFTIRATDTSSVEASGVLHVLVQSIFHVRPGGTGDGGSWATAANISDASSAPEGMGIWVAEGTYSPGSSIYTKSNQTWLGGFPSSGDPGMAERNPAAYPTILDGGGVRDPILYIRDDTQVSVDGFVIQNGLRGVRVYSAHAVTLSNCHVRSNTLAGYGAGLMYQGYSDLTIDSCWFTNNYGRHPSGYGAAIFVNSGVSWDKPLELTVVDSKFCGNRTEATYSSRGAAVLQSAGHYGKTRMERCVFAGNHTNYNGAVFGDRYGDNEYSFVNCVFSGNVADGAGGINYASNTRPATVYLNCTFAGNRSAEEGGALCLRSDDERVVSSIFASNVGADGLGVDIVGGGYLAHNLYFGNTIKTTWGGENSLPQVYEAPGVDPRFRDGFSGTWSAGPVTADAVASHTTFTDASAHWTPGALVGEVVNPDTSQPLHTLIVANTDTALTIVGGGFGAGPGSSYRVYDYRLASDSPAIDAGDTGAVSGLTIPTVDFDGTPRPSDGNADATAVPDIGAFEAPKPSPTPTPTATPTPTPNPNPARAFTGWFMR